MPHSPTQAPSPSPDLPSKHGGQEAVPWESLMLRAQDGDRGAYQALLVAVTPYVRAITRRYLGSGEDAEDAVQDVLLIVHGIRHTYEAGRPFKPWLGTIASRRCIDLLRKRAHRLKYEFESREFESHEFRSVDGAPAEPRGDTPDPSDEAARLESERALHDAVDALPERQREAVRLLRLKELSLNEAAEHSAQSTGALKVAYHRALKSLRRVLAPEDRPHD